MRDKFIVSELQKEVNQLIFEIDRLADPKGKRVIKPIPQGADFGIWAGKDKTWLLG